MRADSIHADAQVIRTEMRVEFSATRDRSREIIGRDGSNADGRGAVEQAGEVAGDESAQSVADESPVLGRADRRGRRPSRG